MTLSQMLKVMFRRCTVFSVLNRKPVGLAIAISLVWIIMGGSVASSETFLRTWGSFGSGDGQFNSPFGLAVQGDEVFTPSLATGCVAGITRQFIRQLTTRWKLHLVEGSFPIQRLLDAREVFLTSTAREVTIVSSFDSKEYGIKQARIAKLISREFQKLVRDATISS